MWTEVEGRAVTSARPDARCAPVHAELSRWHLPCALGGAPRSGRCICRPSLWMAAFFLVAAADVCAEPSASRHAGRLCCNCWRPATRPVRRRFRRRELLAAARRARLAIAFTVAVVAVALAYPLAYFLTFRAGRAAGICLVVLMIPFWTSFLLRVMSWKFLLGSRGRARARCCSTSA